MGRSQSRRPLILASASPQRLKILKRLRRRFRVVPSGASEASRETDPRRLAPLLARRKAKAVARLHPRAAVLGADTLVSCRGKILGKPRSRARSLAMLELLNGRRQRVYTGVCVATEGGKKTRTACVVSDVFTRRLSKETLAAMAGKHLDKAGGYALQDKADPFILRVKGPKDNVIGLPLAAVRRLLAGL